MKLIKLILKLLKAWYWDIPIKFGLIAFAGYFGIMYLIFGTIEANGIKAVLEAHNISFFFACTLPFGFPALLSLGAMFPETTGIGSSDKATLEAAIKYRNGQMSITSDKNAADIYAKTADLDVMNANSNSEVYGKAIRGFNATYGTSNPNKVYKDMMGK